DAFDLLVELVAVRDDRDARVGVVLQDPLREEHHDDALPAALRVPDDAALALPRVLLRSLDAEVLVCARHLLDATIEDDEVLDELEEPLLVAQFEKVLIELVPRVVLLILFPLEEVLLLGECRAVLESLAVVPSKDELDRAEEPRVELLLLVRE